MTNDKMLAKARELATPLGLTAEWLGNPDTVKSVGVGGDFRTYTPILVLTGAHPGDDELAALATEICNHTGVNRVTFELRRLHVCQYCGCPVQSPLSYHETAQDCIDQGAKPSDNLKRSEVLEAAR